MKINIGFSSILIKQTIFSDRYRVNIFKFIFKFLDIFAKERIGFLIGDKWLCFDFYYKFTDLFLRNWNAECFGLCNFKSI